MSVNLGGYNGLFGFLCLVLVILAIVYFLRRA